MSSKYRITTNGKDYRVEAKNALGVWRNRFSFHFSTKGEAREKIDELERHDREKKHEWAEVGDED